MSWFDLGVLLATFAVIFPAELPDKSFIATLVLATRFPRLLVWLGATLAFGTDSPVTDIDPIDAVYTAVTRRDADTHEPLGGWLPEERITLAEALRAYTAGSAAAAQRADELGQLAPGMFADIVVLDPNPFELAPALRFAALLALILLLIEAAREWFGHAGVWGVAILSGLSDVDAITLSLARSAKGDMAAELAVQGIYLAAFSNSLVKAGLIALIGGRELALRTLPVMGLGLLLGLAALLLV